MKGVGLWVGLLMGLDSTHDPSQTETTLRRVITLLRNEIK